MHRQRRRVQHCAPLGRLASWTFHLTLCLAISLGLLATIAVSVATSDWQEMVRRVAVMHLREALRRPVTLQRVQIDFTGLVRIEGLRIADTTQDRYPFFAARQIEVRYQPLLLTSVPLRPVRALRQVVVDAPVVYVARNAKNQWNFQELLNGKRTPSRDRFSGEVVIRNGEVIYRDALRWAPTIPPINEHLVGLSARVIPGENGYLPFRLSARSVEGHVRQFTLAGGVSTTARRTLFEVRAVEADLAYVQQFLPKRLPVALTGGRTNSRWQIMLSPNPATGRVKFDMALLADLQDARGTLRLPNGPTPFAVSRGQVRLTNNVVELSDLRARVNGMDAEVTGAISHFADPTLTLRVRTEQADAATLVRLIPGLSTLPYTWGGRVSGEVQMAGTLRAPRITGHFSGPSIRARELGTLTDLRGDLRFNGKSLELANLAAHGFGGRVTGQAWITLAPQAREVLLFRGEATGVRAEEVLAQYLPPDTPIAGARPPVSLHDLTGKVSGPLTIKVGQGNTPMVTVLAQPKGYVRLAQLTAGDVETSLRLEVRGDQARTQIERLVAATPEGQFRLQGTIDADTSLALKVAASEVNLAKLAAKAQRTDLSGTGYLTAAIDGTLERPILTGTVHAHQGTLAGKPYTDVTGHVQATLGATPEVMLSKVRLVSGDSQLALSGSLRGFDFANGKWQVDGAVQLPRTAMTTLEQSLGIDLPLDGFAEGEITFADLPTQPNGEGKIVLRHPSLLLGGAQLALDTASVEFTLRGKTVTIDNAVLVYHGTPITVTGSLSTDPSLPPDQQLSLQIDAPSLDIDHLTEYLHGTDARAGQLTPDGRLRLPIDVEGQLRVAATITAQLLPTDDTPAGALFARTLRVAGSIDAGDTLKLAGVPYEEFATALEYQGDEQLLTLTGFDLGRRTATGRYAITLTKPGTLQLSNSAVDLDATLCQQPAETAALRGADLALMRQDLLAMADNTENGVDASVLTPLSRLLAAIPAPFAGTGLVNIAMEGPLAKPTITGDVDLNALVVAGNPMPDVTGALAFDVVSRMITIENLVAKGTPAMSDGKVLDPAEVMEATIDGSMTLPLMAADGTQLSPGSMNLDLYAQKVDMRLLGMWSHNDMLAQLKGKATVQAYVMETTDFPHVLASIDVEQPAFMGVDFESMNAIVSIDEEGLWIGRWQATDGNSGTPLLEADGSRTVYIGKKMLRPGSASTLQFIGADKQPMKPLEIIGHFPFDWQHPADAFIPKDEPVFLAMRLPSQELHVVRAYLPDLPEGDGTIDGTLEIHGTRNQMEISNGRLRLQSPRLALRHTNKDLPDVLTDVSMDLGFHATQVNKRLINVVEINDLSAIYDHANQSQPKKDMAVVRWVKSLLGMSKKAQPIQPGAVVAQGTVRIDITQLLTPQGKLLPLEQIPNRLTYDVYAKTVRAPLQWQPTFQGIVTSYLHLTNAPEDHRPLLQGVVYAERSRFTSGAPTSSGQPVKLPFDPRLSLALQVGPDNVFEFGTDQELLRNSLSASFPFTPTKTLSPILLAKDDETLLRQSNGRVVKPPVDPDNPAYTYNANVLKEKSGSRGWLTGTLSKPMVTALYTLEPRKAYIQFPRAKLTMDSGEGEFRFTPDDPAPLRLDAQAVASGVIDGYKIAAEIHGDLFQNMYMTAEDRRKIVLTGSGPDYRLNPTRPWPVQFNMVSAPPGVPPLSDDEIFLRLVGFRDIAAILEGQNQGINSWGTQVGSDILLAPTLDRLRSSFGMLESLSLRYDNTLVPEASLTTTEFGRTKWSAFRLGADYTFSDTRTWNVWMDYRLPEVRLLNNLTVTTNLDERNNVEMNVQYKFSF